MGGSRMKHLCLDNTYAKSPCAYCRLKKVILTVRQVKEKKCLEKQCWHLSKYEHEWWRQREERKQLRRERKASMRAILRNQ